MTDPIATASRDILGGTVCFAGTRVPVSLLFENLQGGLSLDQILDAYPTIQRDAAVRALEFGRNALIEFVKAGLPDTKQDSGYFEQLTGEVESRETTSMGDDCLQAISFAFGGKPVSIQPGSSQVFVDTEPVREVILSSNLVGMIESKEATPSDLTKYLSAASPEMWMEYEGSYSILIDGSSMQDFLKSMKRLPQGQK